MSATSAFSLTDLHRLMHRRFAHRVMVRVVRERLTGHVASRVAVLLTLALSPAVRRARAKSDFGVWTGATVTAKLPRSLNDDVGRWRAWMDVQLRLGDDASRLSQTILRPGIGYAISSAWTAWAGYAYVRTEPPYASQSTTENRIWEQASWSGAMGRTRLGSRTRLEQRFVSTGSQTGWRLREQVKATQPLGTNSIWSAVVSDEYFVTLRSATSGASAGSDRNRFFVGPGVKLSKAVTMEAGYLNQYIFSSTGSGKTDHIIAVNLTGSL